MPNNAPIQAITPSAGGKKLPVPSAQGAFVVNLAASTTPVSLVQPRHPELKAYTFFVSRRREDRRERFRLHMGYFDSQQDAEQMLEVVREIFPAAWAGVAPGRKLAAGLPAGTPAQPASIDTPVAVAVPQPEHQEATESLDSVRAAIASLEDNASETRAAELKLLSDTQTLRLLESQQKAAAAAKPERTIPPTVAAAFTSFSVQLQWSVQPIDISQLPALAIFEAYTLYSAEGRNGNRRWHGLRLGFFTDADSAKQVANYVRSEFPAASVVPITAEERDGASNARHKTQSSTALTATGGANIAVVSGEFKLVDEAKAAQARARSLADVAKAAVAPQAKNPAQTPEPKVPQKKSRAPLTVEETLEILGANTLRLEGKRGEGLSASAITAMEHAARHRPAQKSKLGLLFERLAERISS